MTNLEYLADVINNYHWSNVRSESFTCSAYGSTNHKIVFNLTSDHCAFNGHRNSQITTPEGLSFINTSRTDVNGSWRINNERAAAQLCKSSSIDFPRRVVWPLFYSLTLSILFSITLSFIIDITISKSNRQILKYKVRIFLQRDGSIHILSEPEIPSTYHYFSTI